MNKEDRIRREFEWILKRSGRFLTVEETVKYIKDRFVLNYTFDGNGNDKEISLISGGVTLHVSAYSSRVDIYLSGKPIGPIKWEDSEKIVEHLFDEFYTKFMKINE